MRIAITERYRPYSHANGVRCLIPGSGYCLRVYPALVELESLSQVIRSWKLPVEGPLKEFTVMQDIDGRFVQVCGRGEKNYFRYRCSYSNEDGVIFKVEKGLSEFNS